MGGQPKNKQTINNNEEHRNVANNRNDDHRNATNNHCDDLRNGVNSHHDDHRNNINSHHDDCRNSINNQHDDHRNSINHHTDDQRSGINHPSDVNHHEEHSHSQWHKPYQTLEVDPDNSRTRGSVCRQPPSRLGLDTAYQLANLPPQAKLNLIDASIPLERQE